MRDTGQPLVCSNHISVMIARSFCLDYVIVMKWTCQQGRQLQYKWGRVEMIVYQLDNLLGQYLYL